MRDTDGLDQAWRYEKRLVGIRIYFEDRASGICYWIKCQIILDYLSLLSILFVQCGQLSDLHSRVLYLYQVFL